MAQASRLQPTPIPPSEHQAHMPLSRGGVRGDLLTKAVQVCVCVCVCLVCWWVPMRLRSHLSLVSSWWPITIVSLCVSSM